jgi:hypothetical protein
LEKEIENLEAERARSKNNLRQVSMMVSINSKTNLFFQGLPDEKILMIDQYALNIRDDRVELPLNGGSKESKNKFNISMSMYAKASREMNSTRIISYSF